MVVDSTGAVIGPYMTFPFITRAGSPSDVDIEQANYVVYRTSSNVTLVLRLEYHAGAIIGFNRDLVFLYFPLSGHCTGAAYIDLGYVAHPTAIPAAVVVGNNAYLAVPGYQAILTTALGSYLYGEVCYQSSAGVAVLPAGSPVDVSELSRFLPAFHLE